MEINGLGPILGVILAGGLARRMGGGDKGLRVLGDRPVLTHVIDRLSPQVDRLVLNANGEPTRFTQLGLEIAADSIADHPGPLAGILAGLDWALAHRPATRWVVTIPGDCPFLPGDLVSHLATGLTRAATAAVARSGGRLHPVIGLWSVTLADDLRRAIVTDGLRRVEDWLTRCSAIPVDFPDRQIDPFFNVNTPEDLELAQRLAQGGVNNSSSSSKD
jgi:molybdopterin-guanine dinucleotide biosynthesis protein A